MTRGLHHPEDGNARQALRQRLRTLRRDAGIRVEDLAATLGTTVGALYLYEQRADNPVCATVQRHAAALGHHLNLRPRLNPALPPHRAAVNLTNMARGCDDPEQADGYLRSALMADLVAYRRWLGMSTRDMAAKLGVSVGGGNVSMIEADVKPARISTYQRYCRALGGWLDLELQPLTEPARTHRP